jgi:O-antigen ligase
MLIFARMKTLNYTHYINILAVAYAFILPLSRAGVSFFSALLFILWILEGNIKQKTTYLFQNSVTKSLMAFLLFSLISLAWTEHVYEALEYIKKYWYFLPLFIFFTSLQKEYIPRVLSAFILGMFVSELISYGVFFELWRFKHATVQNLSPFMHHIEYSVFLAFTGLILLGRIFNEKKLLNKVLYTAFFTTVSGNLFLTAGRTGQFAFIVGLFVLALINFKNKMKALFISILLTLLILGIAFNVSHTFHDRVIIGKENILSVIHKSDYCTSWGGRVGSWIISTDIIEKNPILGVGIIDNMKEFHSIIDNQHPEMKCMHEFFMHTHNQFLEICTQMGIVGLALFLYIFYSIVRLPIMERQYKNIKYTYLTVLTFAFVPEVLFHRQFSMALFALIIGLILAEYRIENEV